MIGAAPAFGPSSAEIARRRVWMGADVHGYRWESLGSAELRSRNNPLAIEPGVQPPVTHDQVEPIRLGAGASVSDAVAVRDGNRLVVLWQEYGPVKVVSGEATDAVHGLYYAVLECDE